MNYRMITYILGWILVFESLFMAVPIVTAICFGEFPVMWSFVLGAVICAAAGGLLMLTKPKNVTIYTRESHVIVSLSWIAMSVFGALPLVFSGAIPSFIDALFETVSGFTTTGGSIIAEVEAMPKAVLMWRSFTHWVGGMGVLVFLMVFLPLAGGQNMNIMKAESTGPNVSKLVPRIKDSAMMLYSIYFALTMLEFVLLLAGGMDVFEALNTAFATAGTGGFGVKNDSLGGFSSYIQIVVTAFMLFFSINFNCYYEMISGFKEAVVNLCAKKPKDALKALGKRFKNAFNTEFRVFWYVVISVTLIISVNINDMFTSYGEGLKHSAFTVASIISTTGFSTVDFNVWPELSRTLLVVIMFIGACAGSTGGGIKVTRIIILFKSMKKELLSLAHPKQLKKLKLDGVPIEHEVVRSVNVYLVSFMLIFVLSLVAISFEDHDLITNFTAVTAMINNIGPGLDAVGPTANFAFFSPFSKLVLIFDMLAGRLELFPMLMLFSPATWKK